MPDDLTTVLEWARKHGPADIENAACRVLDWIDNATKLLNERLNGPEGNGDGRNPQTLGTPEGQDAREAQEASQCPTPCDEDCEAGRSHCAEVHVVRWQRGHQSERCPAAAETATQ
jgi:hypothetical protein